MAATRARRPQALERRHEEPDHREQWLDPSDSRDPRGRQSDLQNRLGDLTEESPRPRRRPRRIHLSEPEPQRAPAGAHTRPAYQHAFLRMETRTQDGHVLPPYAASRTGYAVYRRPCRRRASQAAEGTAGAGGPRVRRSGYVHANSSPSRRAGRLTVECIARDVPRAPAHTGGLACGRIGGARRGAAACGREGPGICGGAVAEAGAGARGGKVGVFA